GEGVPTGEHDADLGDVDFGVGCGLDADLDALVCDVGCPERVVHLDGRRDLSGILGDLVHRDRAAGVPHPDLDSVRSGIGAGLRAVHEGAVQPQPESTAVVVGLPDGFIARTVLDLLAVHVHRDRVAG